MNLTQDLAFEIRFAVFSSTRTAGAPEFPLYGFGVGSSGGLPLVWEVGVHCRTAVVFENFYSLKIP